MTYEELIEHCQDAGNDFHQKMLELPCSFPDPEDPIDPPLLMSKIFSEPQTFGDPPPTIHACEVWLATYHTAMTSLTSFKNAMELYKSVAVLALTRHAERWYHPVIPSTCYDKMTAWIATIESKVTAEITAINTLSSTLDSVTVDCTSENWRTAAKARCNILTQITTKVDNLLAMLNWNTYSDWHAGQNYPGAATCPWSQPRSPQPPLDHSDTLLSVIINIYGNP